MTTAVTPPKRIVVKLPALQQEIEINQKWLAERNQIVSAAKEITAISTNEGFENASALMARITKTSNALESMRKALAKPFQDAAACIKEAADEARFVLEDEKARLKTLLGAYAEEQRKAADAERRRIEEQQRQEIERQLAERADAEELGLVEEEQVFTPKVTAPAPVVETPKASSARIIERLAWTVSDEDAIPRGYLTLDPRKVNEHVRAHGDLIKQQVKDGAGANLIPGIVFKIETDVAAR